MCVCVCVCVCLCVIYSESPWEYTSFGLRGMWRASRTLSRRRNPHIQNMHTRMFPWARTRTHLDCVQRRLSRIFRRH